MVNSWRIGEFFEKNQGGDNGVEFAEYFRRSRVFTDYTLSSYEKSLKSN